MINLAFFTGYKMLLSAQCIDVLKNVRLEFKGSTSSFSVRNCAYNKISSEEGGAIFISSNNKVLIEKCMFQECSSTSREIGVGGAFNIKLSGEESGCISKECCIKNCSAAKTCNAFVVQTGTNCVNKLFQVSVSEIDSEFTGFNIAQNFGKQETEYINSTKINIYTYFGITQMNPSDSSFIKFSNIIQSSSLFGGSFQVNNNSNTLVKSVTFINNFVEDGNELFYFKTLKTVIEDSQFKGNNVHYTINSLVGTIYVNNCVFDKYTNAGNIEYNNVKIDTEETVDIDYSGYMECYIAQEETPEEEEECSVIINNYFK